MSIYTKERIKITFGTVVICLTVIISFWVLLFVTDYVMFTLDRPILFSITNITETEGRRVIKEQGVGYYVIQEDGVSKFYLFGKKLK